MRSVADSDVITIGVSGGSASGKTTLARRLRTDLSAVVLSQDRYYRDHLDPTVNFDHPHAIDWAMFESHVHALCSGTRVSAPCYDFATHRRLTSRSTLVEPAPIVIVEGLHVLTRPGVHEQLDLKVFVDVPADLRLVRRIRRDVAERGRSVESVLDQYERHVRPMHLAHVQAGHDMADLVVDGRHAPGDNVVRVRALAAGRRLHL